MGYQPRSLIAPCPFCRGICGGPEIRVKWRWRRGTWVALECACGFRSPWQKDEPDRPAWNTAALAWEAIAGPPRERGYLPPER